MKFDKPIFAETDTCSSLIEEQRINELLLFKIALRNYIDEMDSKSGLSYSVIKKFIPKISAFLAAIVSIIFFLKVLI